MKFNNRVPAYLRYFFQPRVSVFIFTGTAIIFLTFLTTSNALEIAISGIASVFIGIGVNNFSASETHLKDERHAAARMKHIENLMRLVQAKVIRINRNSSHNDSESTRTQLEEVEQLILVCIQLLNDYSARE